MGVVAQVSLVYMCEEWLGVGWAVGGGQPLWEAGAAVQPGDGSRKGDGGIGVCFGKRAGGTR